VLLKETYSAINLCFPNIFKGFRRFLYTVFISCLKYLHYHVQKIIRSTKRRSFSKILENCFNQALDIIKIIGTAIIKSFKRTSIKYSLGAIYGFFHSNISSFLFYFSHLSTIHCTSPIYPHLANLSHCYCALLLVCASLRQT